jgi:phosphomannomutase
MDDSHRPRVAATDGTQGSASLRPIILAPGFQHYAWGDPAFIPQLFGLPVSGRPYAEAWFGAHPALPSLADVEGRKVSLDQLLAETPTSILGAEVAARFAGLPFLFKVLAAADPLSIQVHPSLVRAVSGFRRENAAGLAIQDPKRNYRDPSAKPELFVALTQFQALCGFRTVDEIAAGIEGVPELSALLPGWRQGSNPLRSLLSAYFDLSDAQVCPALARWVRRLADSEPLPDSAEAWIVKADRIFAVDGQSDRGLFFFLLLNLITLEPGQGLFLSPGTPHAYLRGAGVEVMANSDNVLRAGLTKKHADPRELMSNLRFESQNPRVLGPTAEDSTNIMYTTPADAFELHRIDVGSTTTAEHTASGPELLFFLGDTQGSSVEVVCSSTAVSLPSAGCCLIPHGACYRLRATGTGHVLRVSVPAPTPLKEFRGRPVRPLAFGTSGLRGLITDITDLEAYVNTRGFLDYLATVGEARPGTEVAVAGDLRPSTDGPERSILRAVVRAVSDAGCLAVYCGRVPTPAVTAHGLSQNSPSIMVTGSHIPFDRNGIKFNRSKGEVLKDDEAPILRAVEVARRAEYDRPSDESLFADDGMFRSPAPPLPTVAGEARDRYVRRYLEFFPLQALAGMRIAVYEHSAVGAAALVEILRGLGAEVFPFGRSAEFVAIDTEDISEARLREMQVLVDKARAQFGVLHAVLSTDGDSDRPLLLEIADDGRVKFFTGDRLGIVTADYLGADALAVPVTATDAIDRHFENRNVQCVRTRVGSPYVIAAAAQMRGRSCVGWEANGGFFTFSEIERNGRRLSPLPTRDAMLPLLAALHTACERRLCLGEVFALLPARHGAAGLIDGVPADKSRALLAAIAPPAPGMAAAIFGRSRPRIVDASGVEGEASGDVAQRLESLRNWMGSHFGVSRGFGAITRIELLDGMRALFDNHDVVHIRPSGNAPQLRVYALADSEDRARAIVAMSIREPDGVLHALLAALPRT